MTRILFIAILLSIFQSVSSQTYLFEIIDYKPEDSSVKEWKPIIIWSRITQNRKSNSFSFSQALETITYTAFENNDSIYFAKADINSKIISLLFIEKLVIDTTAFEYIKFNLRLLNFNSDSILVSSACIAKYEKINDGFSYSSLDANLNFKNSIIYLQEIHGLYPLDLILKSQEDENTFVKRKYYKFKLYDSGIITRIIN